MAKLLWGFPCSSAGKESACNEGDLDSILGLGRSPGEGNGYPLQYSGLENSMHCIVHGVTKSWTRLSDFRFNFHNDLRIVLALWRICDYSPSFSRACSSFRFRKLTNTNICVVLYITIIKASIDLEGETSWRRWEYCRVSETKQDPVEFPRIGAFLSPISCRQDSSPDFQRMDWNSC